MHGIALFSDQRCGQGDAWHRPYRFMSVPRLN